jgi:hypothetical protein
MAQFVHSVQELFSPATRFHALLDLVADDALARSSPEMATYAFLTACAASGQASVICDYAHEVCGNPSFSSIDIEDMAILNGTILQSWLSESTATIEKETANIVHNFSCALVVARIGCRIASLTSVNNAIKCCGLDCPGVPFGEPAKSFPASKIASTYRTSC